MNTERGFTLIEILVVVLVIAVLAAIALPTLYTQKSETVPPAEVRQNGADLFLSKLPIGRIAFNTPESMNLEEVDTIHLLVDMNKTVEELAKEIKSSERIEGAEVRVADSMEARLSGQGFSILAITPETQAVSMKQPTEWKWDVQAKTPGNQNLHLTLTTTVLIRGAQTPLTLRTFDKSIDVRVSWTRRAETFIDGNWQWLWAAVVVPAAGWWWQKRRQKSHKKR